MAQFKPKCLALTDRNHWHNLIRYIQKENRQNDYEDLNAFYLQKLSDQLKSEFGDKNIELIKTGTRGFRANGDRHPHSWTIVNEKDLIDWMLEE